MGMFSSINNAIATTFDTVGDVAGAMQKTVQMGTTFVDNRAKSQLITDELSVKTETAKTYYKLKQELKADDNLQSAYNEVEAIWNGQPLPTEES